MLFAETWDQEDFQLKHEMNIIDVPQNSLAAIQNLGFEFEDYKANQKIGCWVYERAWNECINHFGHIESRKNFNCVRVNNWFESCKHQHNMMHMMKTYYPERFARHHLSRPVPHETEVLDL